MGKLNTIVSLLTDLRALRSLLTWSFFSVTSYQMISGLVKQGISPKTVIDVGANVGQFTVAAANLFNPEQIHTFEPLPDCLQKLQKHVANLSSVKVYPTALGDRISTVSFNINSHRHSSSILRLSSSHVKAFPEAKETKTISIPVSTLDLVFANVEFSSPTLLKVDVQGYEANVLRGGRETLKRVDFVILEASFKLMYEGELLFTELLPFMSELGFQFIRPVGWLIDPKSEEILQMDALFMRAN
jgi:FkbM family methyltransferase